MLLCCQELTELGSHLLVERPWQRVGNEGVVGNGVDVLDHVIQEVAVRAGRERSTHHTSVSYTAISAPENRNYFKPSTPKDTKSLFLQSKSFASRDSLVAHREEVYPGGLQPVEGPILELGKSMEKIWQKGTVDIWLLAKANPPQPHWMKCLFALIAHLNVPPSMLILF